MLLDDLKTDLDIIDASKDAQLQRLLKKATDKVVKITHRKEEYVIEHLAEEIIELATMAYNRKGAEGLTSQSYSGVSEHYEVEIPKRILAVLYKERVL